MKTQVDIKLLNGSKQEVTYETVETVGMPLADGTGEQVFTAGEPLDEVPIALDFSEGDQQVVEAPEGYVVRSAVITKPEGAEQVIAKGETLAGIPGEYVTPGTTKEIDPYFKDCLVIDNLEDVSAMLSDRGNIGKYVKYTGETGDYTSGQFYKVIDEYAVFARNCPATAVEVTSDTVLTATLEGCKVGDLVVAAFAIRSDLVSLSDGWTLISTSQSTTEINSSNTSNQTLSFAYKYATSTTEELTVTQTTAARIYINMVSLSGASGFTDAGYQYQNNSDVEDATSATFTRPEGKLVLWGVTKSHWLTSGYPVWEVSTDSTLIQLGSTTQSRLLIALDTSGDESVTFTSGATYNTDAYICGALVVDIELEPQLYLVEVDSSEVSDSDVQTVPAFGDTRWNEVVVKKPEGLVPENIPKGIEIAGVPGTLRHVTFVGPEEYLNSNITAFDADVTLIGASAFRGCASLLTVSVPECKVIETSAFYYCSEMKSIYAPKCEFLGPGAFGLCSSLTSLSLPLVTTIRDGVLVSQMSDVTFGCLYDSKYETYYTEVGGVFPVYLKAAQIKQVFDGSVIGANNFYIMRPQSSTSYACFAFSWGSYSQIDLTFPYSDFDTSIPYLAFHSCPKLSELNIRGVIQNKYFPNVYWSSSYYKDMGSGAFQQCSQIGTLKLLFRDTMRFGQMVFSGCSKLSQVYLIPSTLKSSGAITSVLSNIFYNTPMSNSAYLGYYGSIYAPASIVEILKTRTGWSLYSARMVSLTDDETAALIEELEY